MAVMSETLAGRHIDFLNQLNDMMKQSGVGIPLQIILTLAEVEVAADEVLIQVVNPARGIVELHPRKIAALDLGDVIHATQVMDPGDFAFSEYASSTRNSQCHAYTRPNGTQGHLYTI
nr:hypothetical protein OH820_15270 [Streptomyces sp. NBC_00857]